MAIPPASTEPVAQRQEPHQGSDQSRRDQQGGPKVRGEESQAGHFDRHDRQTARDDENEKKGAVHQLNHRKKRRVQVRSVSTARATQDGKGLTGRSTNLGIKVLGALLEYAHRTTSP